VSYANYNAVQARGFVTGPITDTLAAKLSVDLNHRDAFIKNITLGGKTDGTDEFDIRGQLLWNVTPDLKVLLGADFLNDNSGGYPSRLYANFVPVLFPDLSYDANTTNQGFNGVQHRQVGGGLARVTWTNPFGVLTSITGYRNVNDHFPNSVLGDPENELLQIGIVQDKQVSEEVDFTSPTDQSLTWVGGLFYLHSSKLQGGSLIFAFDPATVAGLFSPDTHYTQIANQNISTDSYAIFGEAAYAITDSLKLTLGARETWERKSGVSTVSYSIVDPANLFPASAAYSHSWDAFTPKANLSFQASDKLLLYATVSRGFKSGGYDLSGTGASSSVDVALAFATPFDPETLWSYEIGEKFSGFQDHLIVNGDLFRADYKNLQLSQLVLLSNNELANITSNAPGTTTVQGVELESTALVTDWLTLGLTYGYLDAYFADGTRVPYTPRHQINLSGEIRWPIPSLRGELSLAGDYTYHSQVFFNKGEVLPDYVATRTAWNGIVNLHADYTSDDSAWRVSVWGKNITDDRAFLRASNVGVLFQTLPEFLNPNESLFLVKYYPERTFGVSVTRSF
jgi:iron complex outermembrane receptor protein